MQIPHDSIDVFDPQLKDLIKPPEDGLQSRDFNDLFFVDTTKPAKPGSIVPCLMCKKPMIAPMYVGEAPDQICDECSNVYRETAKLVCGRCGFVIGRVKPGETECGYTIQRREVLHTDTCNVCAPGRPISLVREIAFWMRHHRPSKTILSFTGLPAKGGAVRQPTPSAPRWEGIYIEPAKRRK